MLKIMIVDNEAAIRKGLTHCIRWETLECVVAAQAVDGVDALEQLPAVRPDIVISDIRMPGMDGLELSRRISEEYPQTKVILLTGFPDFAYAQRAIAYRVVDFVLKPTSVESLTRAIEKARARIAEERDRQDMARALADQSEQNLQLERGMLLHDLIGRVELSQLFVLNRVAQLGVNLASYEVLRLDVASPGDGENETGLLPCLRQAQTMLHDCLSDYPVYFVPHGDQACYAVVCTQETAAISGLCEEVVGGIGNISDFLLFIGLSRRYTDPFCMAQAAEEADQAAQFAQYFPEKPVIRFDQMPAIPQQVMKHIYADLHLLKAALANHSQTSAREILRQLFSLIRFNKLPVDTVRRVCVEIHQYCTGLSFSPEAEPCLADNSLPSLKKLMEDSSIDSLEKHMLEFVGQILEESGDGADTEGLIRTVKAYIARHYAQELSLEGLAGQVYLSPSYLSKLFKRETGETLSAYIQSIRVDAAKALLLTTSLKTYEVAARVGVSDPVYFSRLFKKVTGRKPKDFRHEEQNRDKA